MTITNIHQTKTHLSSLIEQVLAGEEVVIAKAGKPVAKLVKYQTPKTKRQPGFWKNKIRIAPDFDAGDEGINKLFYGKD